MTPTRAFASAHAISRPRLDMAIEACWLAALALLPIAFNGKGWLFHFAQPKAGILHFLALAIGVLWAFEWAVRSIERAPTSGETRGWDLMRWAGRNPARWAMVAVAASALGALLSTLMSAVPGVSIWGRDPNEPGYELYSAMSMLVIFFAVAVRVRRREQLTRILYVVAGAGSLSALYGVVQHFGWDPVGYGGGVQRVYSSYGNPIFFGSYLTMTTALTLTLFLMEWPTGRRWWLPLGAFLLGLQMAALWFTGSRGPWLGFAGGMVAFALAAILLLDRRTLLRSAAMCAGSVAVAALLAVLPAQASEGARSFGSVTSLLESQDDIQGGSIQLVEDGLTGRFDIWAGALDLAQSWDKPAQDVGAARFLRPVFGFGQDMYYYSYARSVGPQEVFEIANHAHNYPLQVLMERGLFGLIAFLAMAVLVLVAVVRVAREQRRGSRNSQWATVMVVGLIGALAGRALEQQTGVGRIPDLHLYWVLLGLAVAVHEMVFVSAEQPVRAPGRTARASARAAVVTAGQWAPLVVAIGLFVTALAMFVTRDVQDLRASLLAASASEDLEAKRSQEGYEKLLKASELAPYAEIYPVLVTSLLRNTARAATDQAEQLRITNEAYKLLVRFEEKNPYSYMAQLRLASVVSDEAAYGDASAVPEMLERFRKVVELMPAYPNILGFAANGFVAGRAYQDGLTVADLAISAEPTTNPQPQAWWSRGEALVRLGLERSNTALVEQGIAALQTSIEREPDGRFAVESHLSLAALYDLQGNAEAADRHEEQAEQIKSKLAAAPSG